MDHTDPPPPSAEAPPRRGAAIQVGVIALVLVVCSAAVVLGGREAPELVRASGPYADGFDVDGPLDPIWELPLGEISAIDGAAVVAATSPEGAALAVRRHGLRPRQASAVLAAGGDGAGLLLGYRDPADYWAVVASPASGTWTIVHVQDGAVRERFTPVPAPTTPGTTVRATIDDDSITISIDGGPDASVRTDERLPAADGLVVLPGSPGGTQWDDFEVTAL